MPEQVSLKLAKKTEEGIFGKAISNIGKAVYSSGSNLYTFFIATKRNSVLKHFEANAKTSQIVDEKKRKAVEAKYQKAYENYKMALERYITETIYHKMQKKISTLEEDRRMASYYEVNSLKGIDHVSYEKRLQILLLNMEWEMLSNSKNEKFLKRYRTFYVCQMEELYKALMRHAAVLLANAKEGDKDRYEQIYQIIKEYIQTVLPYKEDTKEKTEALETYQKYVENVDDFSKKEYIQSSKKITLLSLGRTLFHYSLPTVAIEQCYLFLMDELRTSLSNYFLEADKFEAYQVLLNAMEEYTDQVLVQKSYWTKPMEEEEFKKFYEKWSELKKLARIDYDDYKKQREILFITRDLQYMNQKKLKLEEVRKYYHERRLTLHALRNFSNHYAVKKGVWRTRRRQKADEVEGRKD